MVVPPSTIRFSECALPCPALLCSSLFCSAGQTAGSATLFPKHSLGFRFRSFRITARPGPATGECCRRRGFDNDSLIARQTLQQRIHMAARARSNILGNGLLFRRKASSTASPRRATTRRDPAQRAAAAACCRVWREF